MVLNTPLYLSGIPGRTRPHQTVGAQARTLREAFNADAGTVRIVALVSPTCGACLRGATDIRAVFGEVGRRQAARLHRVGTQTRRPGEQRARGHPHHRRPSRRPLLGRQRLPRTGLRPHPRPRPGRLVHLPHLRCRHPVGRCRPARTRLLDEPTRRRKRPHPGLADLRRPRPRTAPPTSPVIRFVKRRSTAVALLLTSAAKVWRHK